jgi:phytoene dehydrogenase-like protein
MSTGQTVVVIGGGHNGLVCAALLARAGSRVTVVERRQELGGIAAADTFHPGYTANGLVYDTSLLRPKVIQALDLQSHGLELRSPASMVCVGADGSSFAVHSELSRISAEDGAAWRKYQAFLTRIRPFFARVLDSEPPEVTRDDAGVIWHLFKVGFSLRRLGANDMSEVMRIPPMTAADWLREYFTDDHLVASLALDASTGSWVGPHSPGTVTNLLLRGALRDREVVGGPMALIAALRKACEAAGVVIRTGAEVHRIRVKQGRAVGVTLADGSTFEGTVVSSCDPKRTLLALLDPADCPSSLARDIERYRMRGTVGVVRLALSGRFEVAGREGKRVEWLRLAHSVDHVERAFDPIKYGQVSAAPALDVRIPTVSTPGLAPDGCEVVQVLARFFPYHRAGGWTDQGRAALGDSVVQTLETVSPGLSGQVIGRQVLTPLDLEEQWGLTEGHLFHGEYALDQLMSMRPVASCAGHRTPIDGLYLCGGGTHPGGGITGGPGILAAAAVTG